MNPQILSLALLLQMAVGLSSSPLNAANRFAAPGEERPSFLFLFSDDQTFRALGALGELEVKTPNLDRLARRGTLFTHCFNQGGWSGAVCVPSRTMLNTGRTLWQSRGTNGQGIAPGVALWGETLGHAGYDTFMAGKWHIPEEALKRSFKTLGPLTGGFRESTTNGGAAYYRPAPGNPWTPDDPQWNGHWMTTNGQTVHSSVLIADAAIDYLKTKAARSTAPFFMYIAFNAPHDPRQSPREFLNFYPPNKLKVPPNFLPKHPFPIEDGFNGRDEILAPYPRTPEVIHVHLQEYYAIITHLDAQIGRILDALETSGKAANTVVIFTSDQGLAVGQHGLLGKQNLYDHSLRMPFIMAGPGIPKGKRNGALFNMQSLFATTCDMAGVPVPESVQFPSIVPLITGVKKQWSDALYAAFLDRQRAVRTGQWKLIRTPQAHEVQLFDVKRDPWEMRNLAADPKRAAVLSMLDAKLGELMREMKDPMPLEEVRFDASPVRITREPLVGARINPMQYGQFVEYLCDLVPAMWAEKLFDGSFEGLSPYKFAFVQQNDFKEKPWYPSGAVNRGRYTLDPTTTISGRVSQKIEVDGPEPCTLGLSQDGIFVDRGKACEFRCWLRAEGLRGPVRVKLHREQTIYAACEFAPGTEWKKFQARMKPSARDVNVTISIEFHGPGTLWLDNASLMPVETMDGWRPDVIEAVRALQPRIIRFGGSALDEPGFGEFEWKDTIGDPDRRKPFRAWGGLQPTGPGLEEFVKFCRAVNAEPMICARFSKRTPRDAAEEVEYFNGATNTTMGLLRMRNGHPEPYRIKYWQVGNERQSDDYDAGVAAFCRAMKGVDAEIRILSSFPTAGSLRNAGAYFDYVCPHHYTPDLAACESSLNFVQQLLRQNAPGRGIKVAVTEWNTTAGDWGLRRAMLMTLANALACSRYHNLLHRHCDLVEIANRSNLINSFGSGIIQTDNHRLYKTPTYHAQLLYATLAGDRPLRIDSGAPSTIGLDLSATFNAGKGEAVLFAVNDAREDVTRLLDFGAFGTEGRRVGVWTLTDRDRAGEPDVRNSFGDPERISARQSSFPAKTAKFEYRFPAYSLTILQWRVKRVDQ